MYSTYNSFSGEGSVDFPEKISWVQNCSFNFPVSTMGGFVEKCMNKRNARMKAKIKAMVNEKTDLRNLMGVR